MERDFFTINVVYFQALMAALSDEEKGMLFDALCLFAETGVDIEPQLPGTVWELAKSHIKM